MRLQDETAHRPSDARTLALGWLAAYLGLSAIVLLASGHGWLVLLHVAGIEVARRTAVAPENPGRTIGDLLPLVVAPLLYAEIPLLIGATGASFHDAIVQRWESVVTGGQPSRSFAAALPFAWVSAVLHAGYLAYYALIFVPPLLLYARGQRRAYAETVFAVTVTCLVCWTAFVLFPVQGPRYLWTPDGISDGSVRRLVLRILAAGSARGAAFPSSHVAVSVVQAVMAWQWQRRVAWVLAPAAALVGLGAVYGGFHYVIDVLAGALLGGVIAFVILRRGAKERAAE